MINFQSKPGEVTQAVKDAIDIGYRHLDCAHVYGNEKEVGEAIAAKIAEGVIKREDLFITSKLWNTYHKTELVEVNLRKTLSDLGIEYLDLYLIHWPMAYKDGSNNFPQTPEGKPLLDDDVDYLDTWKGMEAVLAKGLVKNIGVSNFNSEQIDRLIKNSKVKPVVNQVYEILYMINHRGIRRYVDIVYVSATTLNFNPIRENQDECVYK